MTFSAVGGGCQLVRLPCPNGTSSLVDFNFPIKELRADIAGGATFVSVDLGDFDSDSENLFLEVYNSSNVLLDSVSLFNPDTSESMRTLSLANPNIAYALDLSKPGAPIKWTVVAGSVLVAPRLAGRLLSAYLPD